MQQLTPEQCRLALKAVIDPEIYQNIVDLGLVYQVDVTPANAVAVTMTYTTPACPLGPQIKADVEQTLQRLGASAVQVNVVWQPMWTPYMMTPELQRMLGILSDEEIEPEEEIILPPPPPAKKKSILSRIFGW
jgi:metal-sulfur cluster biosynthetic enzyme